MQFVVDASVAVKWFVQEPHTAAASRFLDQDFELFAPDLLWCEFGNILWKKQVRGTLSSDEARRIIGEFKRVSIGIEATRPLIDAAFDIAVRVGRTVYDSTYLALAERLGCRLVTADEKLYNALRHDRLAGRLLWVEAQP